MIIKLYRKLFMYGLKPRPLQKILGFFLGKPMNVIGEEVMIGFAEGLAQGFADSSAIELKWKEPNTTNEDAGGVPLLLQKHL